MTGMESERARSEKEEKLRKEKKVGRLGLPENHQKRMSLWRQLVNFSFSEKRRGTGGEKWT